MSSVADRRAVSLFLVYDIESTSRRIREDDVMQLAAYCVNDGKFFNQYIRPTVKVHPDALRVHGITPEVLEKQGAVKNFAIAQSLFEQWLREREREARVAGGYADNAPSIVYFIGHNGNSFDRHIWLANMNRHCTPPPQHFPDNWMFACTMNALKTLCPGESDYKLQSLMRKYLDPQQLQSHRADDDVLNLVLVLKKMLLGRTNTASEEDILLMKNVVAHTSYDTMTKLSADAHRYCDLIICKTNPPPPLPPKSASTAMVPSDSKERQGFQEASRQQMSGTPERLGTIGAGLRSKYFWNPPLGASAPSPTKIDCPPVPAPAPIVPRVSPAPIAMAPTDASQAIESPEPSPKTSPTLVYSSDSERSVEDALECFEERDENEVSTQESDDLLEPEDVDRRAPKRPLEPVAEIPIANNPDSQQDGPRKRRLVKVVVTKKTQKYYTYD